MKDPSKGYLSMNEATPDVEQAAKGTDPTSAENVPAESETPAPQQEVHPLVILLSFLQTAEGRDVVKKMGEAWNASQANATRRYSWGLLYAGLCVISIIVAVVVLAWRGDIDPTAGVILSGLAGYLFGRRKES